jgi:hypothetical protein
MKGSKEEIFKIELNQTDLDFLDEILNVFIPSKINPELDQFTTKLKELIKALKESD